MKYTLLILALALAANAKTRRGPLPLKVMDKFYDDLKTPEPKIVGGDIISISERPFQVGLEYSFFDFTFCGGSLIGPNKVLTASHCCDGEAADDLKVRIGTDQNAEGGTVSLFSLSCIKCYLKCILFSDSLGFQSIHAPKLRFQHRRQ